MPEDTDKINFGTYYYDIELIRGDKIHQTFVGKLIITEEVTFATALDGTTTTFTQQDNSATYSAITNEKIDSICV